MDFKVSVDCITAIVGLSRYSASMTLRHGYPKQAMDTRCYPCLCSNGQMHLDLVVSGSQSLCDWFPPTCDPGMSSASECQPGMTD